MCLVTESCPTLCDPMNCSPPGSSVHGILQARILEWTAISFSRNLLITLHRCEFWPDSLHFAGQINLALLSHRFKAVSTRKKATMSASEGPQASLTFLHTGQRNCALTWVQFWLSRTSSRHCLHKLWEQERSSTGGVNSSMHTGHDRTAARASMASTAVCLSPAASPCQASRTGVECGHNRHSRAFLRGWKEQGKLLQTLGAPDVLAGRWQTMPCQGNPAHSLFLEELTSHKHFLHFKAL